MVSAILWSKLMSELDKIRDRAVDILEDAFNKLDKLREELVDGQDELLMDDRIEAVQSQLTDWKDIFNDN